MAHYSSLRELYLTRVREFYRQPARLFWVYGFPTVLAILLGVAFRSRPPEALSVDVVRDASGAEEVMAKLRNYKPAAGRSAVVPNPVSPEEADQRLRTGKAPLVVQPDGTGQVIYRYDPTRSEAVLAKVV